MKDLTEMASRFNPVANLNNHQLQNSINPIVKQLVDQVFQQLEVIFASTYKHTFDSEQKINAAKREWVKAFYENNVNTKELVVQGLRHARSYGSDFLPSCGKFITWCHSLHEDNGESFDRFINRQAPNDYAERLTRYKVGYQCRSHLSDEKARKLWAATIKTYRTKIANGEIAEPDPELSRIETPEKMKQALSEKQRNQQLDRQIAEILSKGQKLFGPHKKRYEELNNENAK